jgi:hypothetical protein
MELREFLANAAVAVPTRPVAPSVGFPQGGVTPTKPGAYWYYQIGEELRALIVAAGLAPDATTLTQVVKAINILTQNAGAIVCVAGGTADAITGAYTPAITVLANGMTLYVRAGSDNLTATPTFKADGTAIKTIVKGNNLPLAIDDISGAGHWLELQYDLALDKWVLLNPANGVISPGLGFKNKAINTDFNVNQDATASGAAVAAGLYFMDGWKAGAGGCTATYAKAGGITTITITAGTLQQVVEADLADSATVTTSWTGTAQGRVNAGAYAASPFATAALPLGSAYTIEFGTGTLTKVQTEKGTVATAYERLTPSQSLSRAQWFYYRSHTTVAPGADFGFPTNLAAASGGAARFAFTHPSPMRQPPSTTITAQTQVDRAGAALVILGSTNRFCVNFSGDVAAGSGTAQWNGVKWTADSRL